MASAAARRPPLPPPTKDGKLMVLTVDGGGIRGLIPATVLKFLESELQRIDEDKEARLADYFDYIGGTSTGALVSVMLAAPNEEKRPFFTADKIVEFYQTHGPDIFKTKHLNWTELGQHMLQAIIAQLAECHTGDNKNLQETREKLEAIRDFLEEVLGHPEIPDNPVQPLGETRGGRQDFGLVGRMGISFFWKQLKGMVEDSVHFLKNLDYTELIRLLFVEPKYDGKYLQNVILKALGPANKPRLHETLTNVVVPVFDVKDCHPVTFSTTQARKEPLLNPYLSDVCIAATAAPIFFPAHGFEIDDCGGAKREYNLIDAGVFANNPTMVTMNEIWRRTIKEHETLPTDCRRFRILSIGTGVANAGHSYTAKQCRWWGILPWIVNISDGSTPLIEMLQYSGGSLVDYNVTLLFKSHGCEDNYLRIEDDCLEDAVIGMDDAKSMDKLIDIGNKLIDREVYRTDWETRRYQPVDGAGTNAEALRDLARELSDERKRRITAAAAAAAAAARARRDHLVPPTPSRRRKMES